MKNFKNFITGMTLIELVIASTILIFVFTISMSTYTNFTSSKRKLLLGNELHNETSFLLERIAREIHNGTIDYQGYWRENLLNRSARHWAHETGEGANPMGAQISANDNLYADKTINGLNSYKNCDAPVLDSSTNGEDTDEGLTVTELQKRKNILFNYRNQFIYPGNTVANDGNDMPSGEVHLNCVKDNYNEVDGYNVYDDETAYGDGPRAFGEEGNGGASAYTAVDLLKNSAQGSSMLWDWDLTDNGGRPDPISNNNPPLLLVKEQQNSSEPKFTHQRTALRYQNGKIKMIRFLGEDTDTTPPDFIPDQWSCDKDFGCGPKGNISYDGTYVFSRNETRKINNGSEDENIGEDNGIGTITDSDLNWKDITPEKIEVTYFDFILSPVKDPHRAFFKKERIQKPQVTLIIEAEAKKSAMRGIKGLPPKIRLQTTVTPRIWDLVDVDN